MNLIVPFLKDHYASIGPNELSVPDYYYKVLLDTVNLSTIAFLMPNEKCSGELFDYVVSVDSLESFSNIDFNSFLEDSIENRIEGQKNTSNWPLSNAIVIKYSSTGPKEKNKTQCKAQTNDGDRCKRMIKEGEEYCWQHD